MTADLSPQEETTLLRIADGDSGEPDVEEADVSRLQSLELVEQRGVLIRPHIERRAKGCPAQAKLTSMPSSKRVATARRRRKAEAASQICSEDRRRAEHISVPSGHSRHCARRLSLQLMARLRHAGGPRGCLLIGVERKLSTHPQNDVIDPKRTWTFHGAGLRPHQFVQQRPGILQIRACRSPR